MHLKPGEYEIEVSAPGYKAMSTHRRVTVRHSIPMTMMMDSVLPPAPERPEKLAARTRPGYTLLHEYVVDVRTGKPIAGVKVRFLNAGVETMTDEDGHFYLSVPTPKPKYPGGIGTDTLVYEKPGYRSLIITNFGIIDEAIGGIAVGLSRGKGRVRLDGTHSLMRESGRDSPRTRPIAFRPHLILVTIEAACDLAKA